MDDPYGSMTEGLLEEHFVLPAIFSDAAHCGILGNPGVKDEHPGGKFNHGVTTGGQATT